MVDNQTISENNCEQKGYYKHRELIESEPTPGTPGTGYLHWKMSSCNSWTLKPMGLNFGGFLKKYISCIYLSERGNRERVQAGWRGRQREKQVPS